MALVFGHFDIAVSAQFTNIVYKYDISLQSQRNRPEKLDYNSLFYLFLKLSHINYIFSENERILLYCNIVHKNKRVKYITPLGLTNIYNISRMSVGYPPLLSKL